VRLGVALPLFCPWRPSAVARTVQGMDRFRLLTAASVRDFKEELPFWTSAAIGARLGISEAEAESALRQAEREGLVAEEWDESVGVGADFNRQLWHLSDAGRTELRRLEDERPKE
jgi:hypothetical protein